ncbi:polysaccharide biosynthesis tyrosine autokinase [Azohydromonas caseinilytica]|uniref:Polysaccharide biosynthesis tyrosine autokinase n=1 Tax=Azohydromonas caseinilytica TaxID=2728836 RepID=A0A848FC40_9BURK|nr:polysaccharide biosynthesis tyrosine autokinase [Azohydromonas caseinilytica]NML17767.1 polysaccharide biosynthesis tyrosine autokinase [Azohydromonas caseinilytica]
MGKREGSILASQAGEFLRRVNGDPAAAQAVNDAELLPETQSIGEFLRRLHALSDEQVEQILAVQRERNLRFGEAAVALRMASQQDVLWALSQQHSHPYAYAHAMEEGGPALHADLVMAREPFSRQAEHFRTLRSRLLIGALAPSPVRRALAVASVGVGEGKSYFAANLAIALSQVGARTLLIDADLRTPRLHRLFGLPNGSGLSNVLARRQQGSPSILAVEGLPHLFIMPSGTLPPNPADLVQRGTLDALLQEMAVAFDHVIVDTPAASHGADSAVIADKAGAALVVARRHACRLAEMQALLGELKRRPVYLAGVLINER